MNLSNNPSQSVTPSSAMSISPATSEVGSLKSQLQRPLSGSKLEVAFRRSSNGAAACGSSPPSGGKVKPTYWGAGKSCNKEGPDRADMDLNWRAGHHNHGKLPKGGHGHEAAAPEMPPPTSVPASPMQQQQQARAAARSDRADKDTNWRNHQQPERGEDKGRLTSNGIKPGRKSKKMQGNALKRLSFEEEHRHIS